MKKNDWILLTSVALYSILFYKQSAGINFLIFNVAAIIMLAIKDQSLLKNKLWLLAAVGSLASSLTVAYYGNTLSFLANILSLSILSALSVSKNASIIFALFYSLFSYCSSIGFMIADIFLRNANSPKRKKAGFWVKLLAGTLIFLVVLAFFLLYQASNPLFKDFTKNINLDFITFSWVMFTFSGLLVMYGFFYHRNIPPMHKFDVESSDDLTQEFVENRKVGFLSRIVSKENQNLSGKILLTLLNILLLLVNFVDVFYLFIVGKLPEGMNYSEFVHKGTGGLIISIIIAIGIILFYFRSEMNFFEKSKALKYLAYFWILQNAILILSTAYKNQLYIEEYSLTFKRIGVYVYLVLTFIGLATSFIKILMTKSNWFLIRRSTWAFYFVLVFASFFDWTGIVTNYNIKNSKNIDKEYLLDLGSTNIPDLLQLPKDTIIKTDIVNSFPDFEYFSSNRYGRNFTNNLHLKMFNFLKETENLEWQSYCYSRQKTSERIYEIDKQGSLRELYLANGGIESLSPLKKFEETKLLDLRNNNIRNLSELNNFKKLEFLDLSLNKIDNISSLPQMDNLKTLQLFNNSLSDLKMLKNVPNLENLDISNNPSVDFKSVPQLIKLKSLNISSDNLSSYQYIAKFPVLKSLTVNAMQNRDMTTLPNIASLEKLEVCNNNISNLELAIFVKYNKLYNLKSLNVSQNNIDNILALTSKIDKPLNKEIGPLLKNLESLNLSNNKLEDLYGFDAYSNLKILDLSANMIYKIDNLMNYQNLENLSLRQNKVFEIKPLQKLANIKILDLSQNEITDISSISELTNLKVLNLSNNQIASLNSLKKFDNLKDLDVSNNKLVNVSDILELKNLEVLNLNGNNIADYTPLKALKNLKELSVYSISDEQLAVLQANLPSTKINVAIKRGSSF